MSPLSRKVMIDGEPVDIRVVQHQADIEELSERITALEQRLEGLLNREKGRQLVEERRQLVSEQRRTWD